MLAVLVLEVANLLIDLAQFILQLLDSVLSTLELVEHGHQVLIGLDQILLLVIHFESRSVDIVVVSPDLLLKLIVLSVGLDEVHPNVVKSSKLVLVDPFGLLMLHRNGINFVVDLLELLLGALELVACISDDLIEVGVLRGQLAELGHKVDLVALDLLVL